MILFNMIVYPPLLWGVSLLLSVGASTITITNTNHINSMVTAEQTATAPPTARGHQNETEGNSAPTHTPATPHITMTHAEVITNTPVQRHHTPTGPESTPTTSDQPAHGGRRTETMPTTEALHRLQSTIVSTAVTGPEKTTTADTGTMSLTTGNTSQTITTTSPLTMTSPTTMTSPITITSPTPSSAKAPSVSEGGSTAFESSSTSTPHSPPEVSSPIHNPSDATVSSSVTVNATTGSLPNLKSQTTETSTASTSSSSTPPPTHESSSTTTPSTPTSAFPDTTELSSTADSLSATTNHSGGVLIPVSPRKLPVPSSKSVTPVTKTTKAPPTTEVQSCSVRHIVKQCLIAVAALAALATIFMVSTIVLCTKLSNRRYRIQKPPPATEMMCISALLPERNHNYTRQRTPVSNGVLVIPSGADSDDDGGDNLTLSSFLPDNDRYV